MLTERYNELQTKCLLSFSDKITAKPCLTQIPFSLLSGIGHEMSIIVFISHQRLSFVKILSHANYGLLPRKKKGILQRKCMARKLKVLIFAHIPLLIFFSQFFVNCLFDNFVMS